MKINWDLVLAIVVMTCALLTGLFIGAAIPRQTRPTAPALVCPPNPTCAELARRADELVRINRVLVDEALRTERERDEALRACAETDGGR